MAARTAVDWENELPYRINVERLRRERTERARKSLKKYGLEGILCFTRPNVRYAVSHPGVYALLPVDGNLVLATIGMRQQVGAQGAPWLNVHSCIPVTSASIAGSVVLNKPAYDNQIKKFASQIKRWIKDAKLQDETIGVDRPLSPSVKAAFDKEGIKTSTDGAKAMAEARMIKTGDEVECLRVAASTVDACFYKVRENIKPGITENDLMGIIHDTAYRLGALMDWSHLDSGPHTWPNWASNSDRAIRPGDLIFTDIMLEYLGYKSCIYRTFSCGKPTQAQKDTYQQVYGWMDDAIKVMKPGATTKEVAEKFPRAEEFGRPSEDAACMMQQAHAIGLSRYEPPLISRIWSLDYPEKIEAGMVFAVETINGTGERTSEYPNGQGVRIEVEVLITETGNELLDKWPIEELTVCEL